MPVLETTHALAALGRLSGWARLDFAEGSVTDPGVLRQVQAILEEEVGELERLSAVTFNPDTDTFRGRARQRISVARSQTYEFTIGPDQMAYRLVDADQAAQFAEENWPDVIEFAAKSGKGKKLNCKPGNVQCGGKCQSGKFNCKHNNTAAQKNAVTKAAKAAKTAPTPNPPKAASLKLKQSETEQDTPSKTDAAPTLRAKEYNPNAIKDLSIQGFREHLTRRRRLEAQDSADEAYNQTFDQWKSGGGFPPTKSGYRTALLRAIQNGADVPDQRLQDGGVKLNKKDQADLQANRQRLAQDRQEYERVQRAIEHPLLDDDEARGYKPLMSADEASIYTQGSFAGGLDFYHGNSQAVINSVSTDGVQPERNSQGIYGQGFYMATSREEAEGYAVAFGRDAAGESGLVSSKVKIKNPYVATADDIEAIGSWFPGDQQNGTDSRSVTEFLRAKGYDSIYMKDRGYFVAFDGRQVATYSAEPFTQQQVNDISAARRASVGTWDDVNARAAASSTGAALGGLDSTEPAYDRPSDDDLFEF